MAAPRVSHPEHPEPPTTSGPVPIRQKPLPERIPYVHEGSHQRAPLSSTLPPLVFGTATFNHQYNSDPYALDTIGLVAAALEHGIRAFDTSPYYGPSESLLGNALASPCVRASFPRTHYMLLTKVGRIASETFDYSAQWVRASVRRSLERLHTDYLDVVYCHDVEFVSPAEVLDAVRELRRIRDEEGSIRYVGICGYPIDVLGDLAELVRSETGEPLDAVQSYAHFTLQNQTLAGPRGIQRLSKAGVQVVPNASILGMGLLRRQGVPIGGLGDFHPAPSSLREAVRNASDFCDTYGERIEVIAMRWALETWITAGELCGSKGDTASGIPWKYEALDEAVDESTNESITSSTNSPLPTITTPKFGISVIGVSSASELSKTMLVWRSILDGLDSSGKEIAARAGRWNRSTEWSQNRNNAVQILADGVREVLGEAFGVSWASPGVGFVNRLEKGEGGDGEEAL